MLIHPVVCQRPKRALAPLPATFENAKHYYGAMRMVTSARRTPSLPFLLPPMLLPLKPPPLPLRLHLSRLATLYVRRQQRFGPTPSRDGSRDPTPSRVATR